MDARADSRRDDILEEFLFVSRFCISVIHNRFATTDRSREIDDELLPFVRVVWIFSAYQVEFKDQERVREPSRFPHLERTDGGGNQGWIVILHDINGDIVPTRMFVSPPLAIFAVEIGPSK